MVMISNGDNMKIVVGTKNAVKIRAVENAMGRIYRNDQFLMALPCRQAMTNYWK